jgi:hypothetical protein
MRFPLDVGEQIASIMGIGTQLGGSCVRSTLGTIVAWPTRRHACAKDSDKRQRQAIAAYAKSAGIEVVAEYYDEAVSGADMIETRPDGQTGVSQRWSVSWPVK